MLVFAHRNEMENENMNYELMSDFEINKAVALIKFEGCTPYFDKGKGKSMVNLEAPLTDDIEFDPCNNPSGAWPIIVEHGICIEKRSRLTDFWVAITWHQISGNEYRPIHQHSDKKPLRAAMIVFLMISE